MDRWLLTLLAICLTASLIFAQKLSAPLLLGAWTDGGDPSEFLLHRVMERSMGLLEDNPDGKLIVRICGDGDFKTVFVKTALNPLRAGNYNIYFQYVPYERVFIANSAKCLGKNKTTFNEYWFIPNNEKLDYDEVYLHQNIFFTSFTVDELDSESSRSKMLKQRTIEFNGNIETFVKILKNNPQSYGFIVHNSKNKRMKNNIAKVKAVLTAEKINNSRIKIVNRIRWDSRKDKFEPILDEVLFFPNLEILELTR